jgi:hypothetical protein
MWVKLNVMNLRKFKKFMDCLSDLSFQELFIFTKLLRREILCMIRCGLYLVVLTQYLMEGFCGNGNELCTMNLAFNLLYLCPFHSTSLTDESGGDFQQVEVCRGEGVAHANKLFLYARWKHYCFKSPRCDKLHSSLVSFVTSSCHFTCSRGPPVVWSGFSFCPCSRRVE